VFIARKKKKINEAEKKWMSQNEEKILIDLS